MFYSIELLSLRRNAKFAKCWLAANLTAKVFNNKFRRQTVAAINIPQTCEELIVYINTNSSERRFSLYLSSQLMFGVTRIFFYQTDALLKFQWELWKNANAGSRIPDAEDTAGKKISRKRLLDLPVDQTLLPLEEPPAVVHTMRRHTVDERRVTLLEADEIFVGGHEAMIRDPGYLDFGALTAEEMDQLLDPEGLRLDESQSPQVRAFPEIVDHVESHSFGVLPESIHRETLKNGPIDVGRIPEINGSLNGIPLPEPIEEPSLPGLPKPHEVALTETPRKRKLPLSPGSETPSKIRHHLNSQHEPEPSGAIPALDDQRSIVPAEQICSNEMILESLDSSNFVVGTTKKKRRKLRIDTETRLPDSQLYQPQTKTLREQTPAPLTLLISATELLTTPSTWRLRRNVALFIDYQLMIRFARELAPDNKVHDFQQTGTPHLPKARENIRATEPSITGLAEMSSSLLKKHAMTSMEISGTDPSKAFNFVSVDEKTSAPPVELPPLASRPGDTAGPSGQFDTEPDLPVDDTEPAVEVSSLPKIVRTLIDEWGVKRQPQVSRSSSARASLDKSIPCIVSKINESETPSTSRASWVKADILGMLEILWHQKRVVDFKDICPPCSCTGKDASQVFGLLLELQKSKIVRLMQAAPYKKIYIQRYSTCF